MQCPTCGAPDTRVIDSRPAEQRSSIRRRRLCESCQGRFTTYERLEPQLTVRKRDGRLETFSATKLAAGISAALADRPVSGSTVEGLVEGVESKFRHAGVQATSDEIGREVLDRLKTLDEVAYLRFASVYKGFQGAEDFEKEMEALESAGEK